MNQMHPASLSEADYNTIENALLASAKGRKFLRIYLEKNRSQETHHLLHSISRLHKATMGEPDFRQNLHRNLQDMVQALSQVQHETPHGDQTTHLLYGLHKVQSELICLMEATDDAQPSHHEQPLTYYDHHYDQTPTRSSKLFGELSTMFYFGNDDDRY